MLDTAGRGSVRLPIPNDASLLWLHFHLAGFTWTPNGVGRITNRVPMLISQ
jgi:hypothetical protein